MDDPSSLSFAAEDKVQHVPMLCLQESEELEELPMPSDKSTHFRLIPLDIRFVLSSQSTSASVGQALGSMTIGLRAVQFPMLFEFEDFPVYPECSSE